MNEIGIRELKQRTSAILRQVQETRRSVTITRRGRAVARLVPVADTAQRRTGDNGFWTELDELAAEIGAHWPEGVSAVDAVREQRREL